MGDVGAIRGRAERGLADRKLLGGCGTYFPGQAVAGDGQGGVAFERVDHGDGEVRVHGGGGHGPEGLAREGKQRAGVATVNGVGPDGRPGRLGDERWFGWITRFRTGRVANYDQQTVASQEKPIVEVGARMRSTGAPAGDFEFLQQRGEGGQLNAEAIA